MSTPGRNALRRCAAAIDAGYTTRAEIQEQAALNMQTVHRACNELLRRGWATNLDKRGKPACYRLTLPLEDIITALGEVVIRSQMDVRPLLQAWPLPVEREVVV